jgi:hypothetical protein
LKSCAYAEADDLWMTGSNQATYFYLPGMISMDQGWRD